MKLTVILFALLLPFSLSNPFLGEQDENHVQVKQQQGVITGTVRLSSKPSSIRSGGGLYGRSAQNTTQAVSTDSVLVILSGDQSSVENNAEFAILNQIDRKFEPGILPIQIGGTVRITNSDPVYHNVFSLTSPHKFDVGRRPTGEHFDVEFDKPGMVDVFCDIHSNMHAIIYVMPPNTLAWKKLASGEMFEFNGLEAGAYTVTFYAMGYSQSEEAVNVSPNNSTNLGTITLTP